MKIKFVKQDCWIGLYWETRQQMSPVFVTITIWYLCLLPCLPIIWETKGKIDPDKQVEGTPL